MTIIYVDDLNEKDKHTKFSFLCKKDFYPFFRNFAEIKTNYNL